MSNNVVRALPAHSRVQEPDLLFHPERMSDKHVHPLIGLSQYGPYSRSTIASVHDPIRIAVITPRALSRKAKGLIEELESSANPIERRQYLVPFPGMSQVFGVRPVVADQGCHVGITEEFDKAIEESTTPQVTLAQKISESISNIESRRSDFDVVLIVLPTQWERGFRGADGDDFDLHDYIKGIAAARSIPVQIVQESRALSYRCRCSVRWRLSIALYCKSGGVPWKLANTDPGTAFVGICFGVKQSDDNSRFVTCCSQVFDADGTGLEFLAYESRDVSFVGKNPFMSRADMRRVMSRSLVLYQHRHAGLTPKRVVVHKTTPFTNDEVDGCFEAWSQTDDIELVQVQQYTPWRAVELSGKGQPSRYPPERGCVLQISGNETLLWTQGNMSRALKKDYYKEGKGIALPILLRRFAGHGPIIGTSVEIMGLTKMNWNNDGIYDRLPVTIGLADSMADIVKRMPKLEPRPYQIRFLI